MYVFIGGIPTAGKSYLAKKIVKLAKRQNITIKHISIDELREKFKQNPRLKYWVDFFWNKDEKEWWLKHAFKEHTEALIKQSRVFWPEILKEINRVQKKYKKAIFEGVNILPELAKRDLDFPGFFLTTKNRDVIYKRLKKEPRWGKTEDLLRFEAINFFKRDKKYITKEAKKHGYKIFDNAKKAEEEILNIFNLNNPKNI